MLRETVYHLEDCSFDRCNWHIDCVLLWGSLTLMQAMFDADVVDEVYMRIVPASRGKGTRLFADQRELRLVETRPFDNGIVMQRYGVKQRS